jgi:hypothetical protein
MKKPEPKQELARKPQGPVSSVPAYLQRTVGQKAEGFEEMESGDMTLPRLAICQALTPQRQRSDPKYIQGLEEGQIFNTITDEVYADSVKIVPLLFFKNRILFRDKDKGGGILCRSDDCKTGVGEPGGDCHRCPFAQFGSARGGSGKGTACNEFHNYPALVVGQDGSINPSGLVVLSFKSTSIPIAKNWNSKMRLRGTDMYGGVYEVSTALEKKSEGSWYSPVIKNAGFVTEATLHQAREAHKAMAELRAAGRLRQDVEGLDREPGEEG